MTGETGVWKPAARIAFRFVFCYVAIYATYVLDYIIQEIASSFTDAYSPAFPSNVLHVVVPWFANHVLFLHRVIVVFSGGSGDTTYDWVLIALNVIVALAATTIWSILDRKRAGYVRLYACLRFVAALLLSAEMLEYGIAKVIPAQFGAMTLSRLYATLGSQSPMGVLWNFMAASPGYTVFAGSLEVTAGLLLVVPRLRALGAIAAAVALTNIFALNVFYDVPVKLFSFHLLLLALLVLAPEFSRLANLLVFERAPGPPAPSALFGSAALNRAIVGASWVAIAAFATFTFVSVLTGYRKELAKVDPSAPFYGAWTVDEFVPSAAGGPLGPGDRLERLIVQSPTSAYVEAGGVMWPRTLWVNQKNRTMALEQAFGDTWTARFSYAAIRPNVLVLNGRVNGIPFRAKLHLEDTSRLELVRDHINLIKEYPH
jgi:hypothetical protein